MAPDVVRIICPNLKCKALLSVPGLARGKTVRCRQCGARVMIPELREKPLAAPAAGEPAAPAAQD